MIVSNIIELDFAYVYNSKNDIVRAIDYAADYPNYLCGYPYNKTDLLYNMKDYATSSEVNQQALDMAKEMKKQAMVEACNSLAEKIGQVQ